MTAILSDWEAFARDRCRPAADAMSGSELRDGAASVLRALAEDQRLTETAEERRERARGASSGRVGAIAETARAHAAQRLTAGFTLDQVVAEYRALRASVIREWTRDESAAGDGRLDQLVRFVEALDESLTEAIRCFCDGLEGARDTFIGILGHDLRNPLAAVQAAAELQQLSDSPIQRDAAKRALRSIRAMSDLISDLLDFTRTRLGEPLPISREPLDLAETTREVLRGFAMAHPERDFELDCLGETQGAWDGDRIKQLLSNLITNAIEHGDSSAPIGVALGGRADYVDLSIHNHGTPIPPHMQRIIFDPLTRGSKRRSGRRGSGGLGLGLYIVQQVAVAHGGSVHLASDEASGTRFLVRLPRG